MSVKAQRSLRWVIISFLCHVFVPCLIRRKKNIFLSFSCRFFRFFQSIFRDLTFRRNELLWRNFEKDFQSGFFSIFEFMKMLEFVASVEEIGFFWFVNKKCSYNFRVNNCGDNSDEDACRLNPCTRYGHCSQRCMWDGDVDNFTCLCDTGYRNVLHGKNRTCLADGPPAFLLVAEQNQLRSLDPYHSMRLYILPNVWFIYHVIKWSVDCLIVD